jgi:hypothetical protein
MLGCLMSSRVALKCEPTWWTDHLCLGFAPGGASPAPTKTAGAGNAVLGG